MTSKKIFCLLHKLIIFQTHVPINKDNVAEQLFTKQLRSVVLNKLPALLFHTLKPAWCLDKFRSFFRIVWSRWCVCYKFKAQRIAFLRQRLWATFFVHFILQDPRKWARLAGQNTARLQGREKQEKILETNARSFNQGVLWPAKRPTRQMFEATFWNA